MRKHLSLILLAIGVSLATGCAGMTKNWSKSMPWGQKSSQISDGKYQAPVKIVALWSPAMYTVAGKPPTRGFGGRLYFYNAKNETIPVQGQLVVYCFNDTNKSGDHKQADRRIAFTPEQFSGHFSATELGASYSVWVPWDAVGNPQTEISLLPIFTAATGQVTVGQESLGLLPGPETPIQEKSVEEIILAPKIKQIGDITQVSLEQDVPEQSIGSSRIKSTSITLPQSLAERVAASRNQEPRLPASVFAPNNPAQSRNIPMAAATNQGAAEIQPSASAEAIENLNSTPAPALLSHSERFPLAVPALQRPQPISGLAPLPRPPSTLPSNHP